MFDADASRLGVVRKYKHISTAVCNLSSSFKLGCICKLPSANFRRKVGRKSCLLRVNTCVADRHDVRIIRLNVQWLCSTIRAVVISPLQIFRSNTGMKPLQRRCVAISSMFTTVLTILSLEERYHEGDHKHLERMPCIAFIRELLRQCKDVSLRTSSVTNDVIFWAKTGIHRGSFRRLAAVPPKSIKVLNDPKLHVRHRLYSVVG